MDSFETLRDMVTCPIDYQEFDDPRLLPCGHVFCKNCLDRYLEKIHAEDGFGNKLLDCPVCRNSVPINSRDGASSLRPSFTHKELINFIHENLDKQSNSQDQLEKASGNSLDLTPQVSNHSSGSSNYFDSSPGPHNSKRRRSSVYKHDLVKRMVDSVILGPENSQDLHKQLSGLQEFLSHLSPQDQIKFINTAPNFMHSMSQPGISDCSNIGLPHPTPSAPPMPQSGFFDELTCQPVGDFSRHTPTMNSGRFSGAASHLRHDNYNAPERPPSPKTQDCRSPSQSDYEQSRSLHIVKDMMRRRSAYSRLYKDQGYCVLECNHGTCVDMQMMSCGNYPDQTAPNSSNTMMRFTVTLNNDHLCLFGRKVILSRQDQLYPALKSYAFPTHNNDEIKRSRSLRECLKYWKQLSIDYQTCISVKYIRIFHRRIYLSAVIKRSPDCHAQTQRNRQSMSVDDPEDEDPESPSSLDPSEFGLVMWFDTPDPDHCNSSDEELFRIQGISSPFASPIDNPRSLPVIQGIDIDRSNGDVYLAMPSRCAICRMNDDLSVVLNEWFLKDPESSYPEFLCFNARDCEIWASCPTEDKIVILNVNDSRVLHLNTHLTFDIRPSHIIYTSDRKIVFLDSEKSFLYWLSKVNMDMCVQKLEYKNAGDKKHQILSIQPMEEVVASLPSGHHKKRPGATRRCLEGGIVCTEACAAYLIFPNQTLIEPSWSQKVYQMVLK